MKYYTVDENPFMQVYVDLTTRCNMSCNVCYQTGDDPDMTLEYFTEVCKRLPKRTFLRFLGGEPTIHPQLFEFMQVASKYKHSVSIITNGIKFADKNFCKEIKALKIPFVIGMDMSGGINHDDVYEKINGVECAETKLKALRYMAEAKFRRVCLTAIIVRDLNEFVIPELTYLCSVYPKTARFIHYRTMNKVGRWIESVPYTCTELTKVVQSYVCEDRNYKVLRDGVHSDQGVCRKCCYSFWLHGNLLIEVIETGSENVYKCWRRGKLLDNFKLQRFFEHMKEVDCK